MYKLYSITILILILSVCPGFTLCASSKSNDITIDTTQYSTTMETASDIIQEENNENSKAESHWWKNIEFIVAIVALIGAILGALLKGAFETWSQKLESRRQMISNVTDNIEELAQKYYWLLANNSSVFGGLLNEYLMKREELQLQLFSNKEEITATFKELVDKTYAAHSFYYYSRFIKVIYDFQWVTGNTYFLKNFWAGKILEKLYNRLQSILQESDIDANRVLDVIDQERSELKKQNLNDKNDTLYSYMNKVKQNEFLSKEFQNFKIWLEKKPDKVWEAANCLNAYSALFNYELGILYKDWYENLRTDISHRDLEKISFLNWDTKQTIMRISREKTTLRPIGVSKSESKDVDKIERPKEIREELKSDKSRKLPHTETDFTPPDMDNDQQTLKLKELVIENLQSGI